MRTLIVGCGDVGVRVAARAVAGGESVVGLVRSNDSARRIRSVGARALVVDLDETVSRLPPCDRLVYCAPPSPRGVEDNRLQRVTAALDGVPPHMVYVSTSGVYGDCGGDWVDETRPPNPLSPRAIRRVHAERCVSEWARHATILRVPGIYGPGRLPLERLRAGEPVLEEASGVWTNRIYVDDLAAMVWSAACNEWPHAIYNACDGRPTSHATYYDSLAELLGLPSPPKIGWAEASGFFSEQRLSFLRESRRLSNSRLMNETDCRIHFPDYRDGLIAALRGEADFASRF